MVRVRANTARSPVGGGGENRWYLPTASFGRRPENARRSKMFRVKPSRRRLAHEAAEFRRPPLLALRAKEPHPRRPADNRSGLRAVVFLSAGGAFHAEPHGRPVLPYDR